MRLSLQRRNDHLLLGGSLLLLFLSASQLSYAPKHGIHTVVHVSLADVCVWLIGGLLLLPALGSTRWGRSFAVVVAFGALTASILLSHRGHAFVSVFYHGRHSGQFKPAVLSAACALFASWQAFHLFWRAHCKQDAAPFVRIPGFPVEVTAFLIVALISGLVFTAPSGSIADLFHTPDGKDSLRKAVLFLVELFQHFGIALFLFLLTLRCAGRTRLAVRILFLGSLISACAALVQLVHHVPAPLVRGLMQSRSVYGGFQSVVLPLMLGAALGARRRLVQIGYLCVIAFVLATVMSSAAFWCAFAGLTVTAVASRARAARQAIGALLAFAVLLIAVSPARRYHLSSELSQVHQRVSAAIRAGEEQSGRPAPTLKKQYVEWIAGLYMASEHFWLGVGPGQYQLNIGEYYGQDPNPAIRLEPDTNNLYFVYFASLGLAGLVLLSQILVSAVRRTARISAPSQSHPGSDDRDTGQWWHTAEGRALACGVLGALVAFASVNLFTSLLVRGVGLLLPFLLALTVWMEQEAPD